MIYPDEILKGIPNSTYIDEYDYPASHLFSFEGKKSKYREDNFIEESICWRDDEKAVELLLAQKKEDMTLQFKAGVAVLSRNEIDRLKKNPMYKQKFAYERDKIPGNDYHGNLLLKNDVPSKVRKKLVAHIACCATVVITQNTLTNIYHKKARSFFHRLRYYLSLIKKRKTILYLLQFKH